MQKNTLAFQLASRSQRGYSLIEIAVAMALVAGLIIALMSGIQKVRLDKQLNDTRIDAIKSMNVASSTFATIDGTTGATPQVLSSLNVWPSERVKNMGAANVEILGHFKGSREFMWANRNGYPSMPVNTGFIYHITNVPNEVCAPLVTSLASAPNIFQIQAGNFAANPTNGSPPVGMPIIKTGITGELNMATIATACGSGGALKHIVVQFFKN